MFTRSHYQPDRAAGGPLNRILRKFPTVEIEATKATPNWCYRDDRNNEFIFVPHVRALDERLINPVSMTPDQFERQHGPHPGHVVTWHAKRVPPPERPPLTFWQRLLPWTRPKLTDAEKWARKQLD